MNPTLTSSLWITLIGMSLVFIALLLLWGLMALMVRLTSPHGQAEAPSEEEQQAEEPQAAGELAPLSELDGTRQKAVAAAVAVALALNPNKNGHQLVRPAVGTFSAWQSVLRGNQLTQHSRMYSRKQRGTEQ